MNKAALALALVAPAFGMGRKPATPAEVTMTDTWHGNQAAKALSAVVRDAAAWERAWGEALEGAAPAVDFGTHVAFVVAAAAVPTGGWRVTLGPLRVEDGVGVVRYRLEGPPEGAFTIQAFTSPWAAAAYPKPSGVEEFKLVRED